MMNNIQIHDLPPTVQNLVRLIGGVKTLKLVEAMGGTTFPVPVGKHRLGKMRFEMLAEVIGVDAARTLCTHYAREALYIPNCASALRKLRDRSIHHRFDALLKANYSANDAVALIAREHRLSDRRIWDILKVLPVEEAQASLF